MNAIHEMHETSEPVAAFHDVIIVGAGMAGCAVAQALARADQPRRRKILMLDLHRGCSPRFSGEFIHPRGAQVLEDLGFYKPLIEAGGVDVDGFVVIEGAEGRKVELNYKDIRRNRPQGISVHHKTLVRTMRRVVSERDQVELREGWRVMDLIRRGQAIVGVVAKDPEGEIHELRSSLVIAADGKASSARKLAGIPDGREMLGFTAGLCVVDPATTAPLHANVVLGAPGPILCYPIERDPDGRLRARLTFDIPSHMPAKGRAIGDYLLSSYVCHLPSALAAQVAQVIREHPEELEIAPTFNLPAPPATHPGLVLVGDAAGCSHPITASGMTMGLLDASYLGREATRRAFSKDELWLTPRNLQRFRNRHDKYVPTRQALADAIYEAFRGADEGSRSIRRALFKYWHSSHRNRVRSLALLACAESRPHVFLSEYMKTAGHVLGTSLVPRRAAHYPFEDRLREVTGAMGLATDKLGIFAHVAWAQVRPTWLSPM